MGLPIYVKNLIALLREVGGVEQQHLADTLGVTPGAVSMWATGRRPIPRHHFPTLLALVVDVVRAHAALWRDELIIRIDAWELEMFVSTGELAQEMRRHLEALQGPYAKVDPLTIPIEARKELRYHAYRLTDLFDYLQAYERPPDQHTHEPSQDPEAFLRRAVRDFVPEFLEEGEG